MGVAADQHLEGSWFSHPASKLHCYVLHSILAACLWENSKIKVSSITIFVEIPALERI